MRRRAGYGTAHKRDGGCVTDLPLSARRALLKAIVTRVPKRFELVRSEEVHSTSKEERKTRLLEYFDKCVAAGDEGLVVKDLNSTYFVGERSREQKKWIKMKPDYSDEVESLDLLILGAYYSEGTRRAGQLSHFLIGVRSDDSPELWLHIGKVGSGFTDAELAKFHERVADKWLEYDHARPPAWWYPFAAGLRRDDRPHKVLRPEHSCLVSVTCFELCKTDQFAAGWTPRFPRARHPERLSPFRFDDKPWDESLTMRGLLEAVSTHRQRGRAAAGGGADDDDAAESARANKKRKGQGAGRASRSALAGFRDVAPERRRDERLLRGSHLLRDVRVDARPAGPSSRPCPGGGAAAAAANPGARPRKSELVALIQAAGGEHVMNVGNAPPRQRAPGGGGRGPPRRHDRRRRAR